MALCPQLLLDLLAPCLPLQAILAFFSALPDHARPLRVQQLLGAGGGCGPPTPCAPGRLACRLLRRDGERDSVHAPDASRSGPGAHTAAGVRGGDQGSDGQGPARQAARLAELSEPSSASRRGLAPVPVNKQPPPRRRAHTFNNRGTSNSLLFAFSRSKFINGCFKSLTTVLGPPGSC